MKDHTEPEKQFRECLQTQLAAGQLGSSVKFFLFPESATKKEKLFMCIFYDIISCQAFSYSTVWFRLQN